MLSSYFVRVFMCTSATLTHIAIGVKPVLISDPACVSPPLFHEGSAPVEDLPIPADSVVQEVFGEMLNGSGVPYHRLMAVIGSCAVCDQVMVLPNILTHPCLARTKESGPYPSKHPRLPEDRRVLPTAGSRIKELEAMSATIETDHQSDNDYDAEFVDKMNSKFALYLLFEAAADIWLSRFYEAQAKAKVQFPHAARLHPADEEISYHEH